MTKQFNEFYVDDTCIPEGSIEDIQKQLSDLVEKYGQNLKLYVEGGDDPSYYIYQYREETDIEYNRRIAHVENQKKFQEKHDRELYEKLKEKFGDK